MKDWKQYTLADLGKIVGGSTPSTKQSSYYNGDIPWITPKDLSTNRGRFISSGERSITITGLNSCSTNLVPPNSILFSSRAPIGYIAIAENDLCTNQGIKCFVPHNEINPLFLYYLLLYNSKKIENLGTGTTFKEVSGNVLKQFKVTIPINLSEQKAISQFLGSFDDKIENNKKINHNLSSSMADR
jgi:type I restriction enzyme S subunit